MQMRCEPIPAGPTASAPAILEPVSDGETWRSMVRYEELTRKLNLPPGFSPPAELAHADLRARALSRADLDDDVRGINASIELNQRTRGGGWPTEPVTAE